MGVLAQLFNFIPRMEPGGLAWDKLVDLLILHAVNFLAVYCFFIICEIAFCFQLCIHLYTSSFPSFVSTSEFSPCISTFASSLGGGVNSTVVSVKDLSSCVSHMLLKELSLPSWGSCSFLWISPPCSSSVAIFSQTLAAWCDWGVLGGPRWSSVSFEVVWRSVSFEAITSFVCICFSGLRNCRLRTIMTAVMKKYEEPLRQEIRPRNMILKVKTKDGLRATKGRHHPCHGI